MEASLIGKALDFGSKECGFKSLVSNLYYNSYAYAINHVNLITSSKKRFSLIKVNNKILNLIVLFKKLGFLNSTLLTKNNKALIKISPFVYKQTTFFKTAKLISTPSKMFTIKYKSLRILERSIGETILILETNKGIITHKEASNLKIGGKILCILS